MSCGYCESVREIARKNSREAVRLELKNRFLERKVEELESQNLEVKLSLQLIAAMCGSPDAAEGCRNILAEIGLLKKKGVQIYV